MDPFENEDELSNNSIPSDSPNDSTFIQSLDSSNSLIETESSQPSPHQVTRNSSDKSLIDETLEEKLTPVDIKELKRRRLALIRSDQDLSNIVIFLTFIMTLSHVFH